jgi:uncharacterized protein YndB with AHSA1/START domain
MTPVALAFEVDVAAPPEAVWAVLVAAEGWPRWNPGIAFATFRGSAVAPGAPLLFQIDGLKIRAALLTVTPPVELAGRFHTLGAHGTFQWTLETVPAADDPGPEAPSPENPGPADPLPPKTRVRLEEAWRGVAPFLLRGTLRRTLEVSRLHWLERLKDRVEAGIKAGAEGGRNEAGAGLTPPAETAQDQVPPPHHPSGVPRGV